MFACGRHSYHIVLVAPDPCRGFARTVAAAFAAAVVAGPAACAGGEVAYRLRLAADDWPLLEDALRLCRRVGYVAAVGGRVVASRPPS